MSGLSVCLDLGAFGQQQFTVPVNDMDVTLSGFLDSALKELEAQCKIKLPETEEEDLIDHHDFHVFTSEREMELPLRSKLRDIPFLRESATPLLLLESPIFRNEEQVEIDSRVNRIRKETYGAKVRAPHPPARSVSLGSQKMNREAMIYLAGRQEYVENGVSDNHWKQMYNPGDVASLSDTSLSVPEELLDQLLTPSKSTSHLSQTSEGDSMSLQSCGSDQQSHLDALGSIRRRLGSTNRPSSVATSHSRVSVSPMPLLKTKSEADAVSFGSENDPTGMSAPPCSAAGNPNSVADSLSMNSDEFQTSSPKSLAPINTPFAVVVRTSSNSSESQEPAAVNVDKSHEGTPVDHLGLGSPSHSPSSSPMLNRKVRLATRRGSKLRPGLGHSRRGSDDAEDRENSMSPSPGGELFSRRSTMVGSKMGSVVISPSHTRVYGTIKVFLIEFDIPAVHLICPLEIRGDYTVAQIKQTLWKHLREQGHIMQEMDVLWDLEKFTFTYEMNKEIYELYDEQQIFQTSTVSQLWRQERSIGGRLTVEPKKVESKEEKQLNMTISAMIGIGLYQLHFANNDELDTTRRKMVAVRRQAVNHRDPIAYAMEVEVQFQTLSPIVKEVVGAEERILIRIHFNPGAYQTHQVDMHMLADDFLEFVFPAAAHKQKTLGLPENCKASDYVLKVAGRNSYVHGPYELIQFSQIVRMLTKGNDVELGLVRRKDTTDDLPRDIPDWNLIDDSTGMTGTHEELSALAKEHTQVFTMSMWDIQRKFRIRVVGLDNFRDSAECDILYLQVSVCHGGEKLCEDQFTNDIGATCYPRWNQWLVFSITVKNLPKAARLCIRVVGGFRRSESKKRGTWGRRESTMRQSTLKDPTTQDRIFHWVNMQILDHRALLRQGLLRLSLWPCNGEEVSPVGSTAVNPDGNNAAALYIELDSYAHPVACPTAGWREDQPAPVDMITRDSPFRTELDKSISSDPLAPLDPAQKELLWKCRKNILIKPEALPKFLQCVDWADLDKVTEVHRLLMVWSPVTMEVALELLDYHFADEKVRSLAVRRLEKLTNDEVLIFLLQLIQVLKFEPYHDSALARFLLKRALHSKRIGHFFFWYLRSEMDTPEFSQRFGILLEAYLRGCGEAMLNELQTQHKAVSDIMRVAEGLKKQMERHKNVNDYVKEELRRDLTDCSFSPPFDPGQKMGCINVDKCRIMDSKKSPLWIEFEDTDPTDLTNRPIKIIAKHGDDLRQDMLTLQMLSLMDSLWKNCGLDLHLIPYGCISTGHNMGVIQVVQDAETVAKIQQHHGGSLSTLKEEPLYEWLKKKNSNPRSLEKAVETFLLSCAGYCVATYVLGIGDRHNDNIMVTTSGNLFHIDFGHFLGNTKAFLGVNRERAPFVLTPDFEYVLGKRQSETFKRFETTAVKAYLIIRKNANLLINLFSMMKCTGIPELRSVEDLEYLRSVLILDRPEDKAAEHFRQQIHKCLKLQWSTQLSWFAHNVVHRTS